eukprot:TRINITY_DN17523_c0_g1_i1.p1 TRINITY_DN17523_c0_g1~~TRINITY_DN17523_c0_g1_i1.p1  ORF type:complete len:257 (-),score=70.89 TRINITY_DN17523_c0_g1_i1:40-810(-)
MEQKRENDGFVIKKGRYGNTEILIKSGMKDKDLVALMAKEEKKNDKSAVFLFVPEYMMPNHLQTILSRHYKLHRTQQMGNILNYVYYKWTAKGVDKVPAYASSVEGVTALILSPDEKKMLIVKEGQQFWKFVSGSVEQGETALEAIVREIQEEVGLEVDQEKPVFYLGGWNKKRVRFGCINDNFSCYVLKATSEDLKLDVTEIREAMWVPLEDFTSNADTHGLQSEGIAWCLNYMNGRYLTVNEAYSNRSGYNFIA